jgi:D-alanyl-D-alanine carboxypeptidase
MGRSHPPIIFALVLVSCAFGCSPDSPGGDSARAGAELQALIESVVASDDAIRGAALAVISPSRNLDWEGAAGFADPDSATPMTPANPVRIASNTKTFVAAAFLRLAEDGGVDLDSPVADHLEPELTELLESDGYDPEAITIRHLLTHTGGLDDHGGAEAYTKAIIADPTHHWTPIEQITALTEWGDPLADPGQVYSYSDSGYVLLGTILEGLTGRPLAIAVRELLDLDGLGLCCTWWEIMEPAPTNTAPRAHQYFGELDVTDFVPYFDLYGGGGLVATMHDLAWFFGSLFRGGVYHDPATIEIMLSTFDDLGPSPAADAGSLPPGSYRMGVWVLESEGFVSYHHTGFWGTMAVHVPELDLSLAATANQNRAKPVFDRILAETIPIVAGIRAPE